MGLNKNKKIDDSVEMDTDEVDAIMKDKKEPYSVTLSPLKIEACRTALGLSKKEFNLSNFLDALLYQYLKNKVKEKK